jgi:hypothetical protein
MDYILFKTDSWNLDQGKGVPKSLAEIFLMIHVCIIIQE